MCLLQFFRLKSDFLKKSSKVDFGPQLSNKLLAPAHLGWPDPKIHVVGPPNYFQKTRFLALLGRLEAFQTTFYIKKICDFLTKNWPSEGQPEKVVAFTRFLKKIEILEKLPGDGLYGVKLSQQLEIRGLETLKMPGNGLFWRFLVKSRFLAYKIDIFHI